MGDLYLSRKMATSPISGYGAPNWVPASPTIASKISRASRASAATIHGNENDVEELEMLLEVLFPLFIYIYRILLPQSISINLCFHLYHNWILCLWSVQAYFMQIDGTLNKLTTVSSLDFFIPWKEFNIRPNLEFFIFIFFCLYI